MEKWMLHRRGRPPGVDEADELNAEAEEEGLGIGMPASRRKECFEPREQEATTRLLALLVSQTTTSNKVQTGDFACFSSNSMLGVGEVHCVPLFAD